MSTFSANVTQKIGGGGTINKTNSGNTTLVTTAANQYAKVILAASMLQAAGSGSQLSLVIGGVAIRSVSAGGTGSYSLHNEREVSVSTEGVKLIEIIVPPSSTLSANLTVSGTATCNVVGSFTLFENTP